MVGLTIRVWPFILKATAVAEELSEGDMENFLRIIAPRTSTTNAARCSFLARRHNSHQVEAALFALELSMAVAM